MRSGIAMPSGASKRYGVLALLLLLILAVRLAPGAGVWYATSLYPGVSLVLSAVASIVPFSLEEWIVIVAVAFLLLFPLVGAMRRIGGWKILLHEVEAVLWIVCWFYVGWGCNYFREDFYTRCEVEPVEAEKVAFQQFLATYADSINACYTETFNLDPSRAEQQIKTAYQKLPSAYGLCQPQTFQHPKPVCFNRLYSGVGVLGYMGPFMAESQLNLQLSPVQYPFTYAHELAHLLGVSNEAEANYWAYDLCTRSEDRQLRYCGYYGLLPYLINNATTLLEPEEKSAWLATLDPRILNDLRAQRQFWHEQQIGWINDIQEAVYDWYLKSNRIPSGKANYSQVVQMVLSVRAKNE